MVMKHQHIHRLFANNYISGLGHRVEFSKEFRGLCSVEINEKIHWELEMRYWDILMISHLMTGRIEEK